VEKAVAEMYALQDTVLGIVFSLDNDFYLTGGTALHRFHVHGRYSNDLDFFAPDDLRFGENIKQVLDALTDNGVRFDRGVRTRDFHRLIVNDTLQVDFVNDRVYRDGNSVIIQGMRIDNVRNILTNKLAAVMDRDEEKDIFDIFAIASHESFVWSEMLEILQKKAPVEKELLIERIRAFPLEWLSNLKILQPLTVDKESITRLCDDIARGGSNSFHGSDSDVRY